MDLHKAGCQCFISSRFRGGSDIFVGAVMLIIGMGFFQLGAEIAMTPLGEGIGVQMSKTHKVLVILFIGFLMGLIQTLVLPQLALYWGKKLYS